MRSILVLFAPVVLAACGGGDRDGTAISFNANGSDGAIKAAAGKDGKIAIKAPGFTGSFDLPSIKLDASNFDLDGVKLPPESSITSMNINADGDGDQGKAADGGLSVSFRSPREAAAVRDWFASRLRAAGYTLAGAGDGLKGTTEEGKAFTLTTKAAGPGASESTIVIGG